MASNKIKRTDKQIQDDKSKAIMNLVIKKASYYRSNPHRFVEEMWGIHLKLFQKILLWCFMHYNYCFYLAARGQGKSWLTGLFCCVRAVLYPGSKIIVCSYTRKQGNEVLLKIQDDFMKNSPILASEIEKCNIGQNEAAIYFKNSSFIRVVTASDNGRGARANVLIVDESRMVEKKIIDTVLKKFLTAPRHPKYLDKKEYEHLTERNKEIYMSSCWFSDSDCFKQAQSYTAALLDDSREYMICSLPYQVSIKENLLSRDQVADEMAEQTFSDITWMMEMEARFYGFGDESLFNYNTLTSRRRINESFYPLEVYRNKGIKVPDLSKGEERILSVDIALMASKSHANDASAFIISSCMPTSDNNYITNILYIETAEGLVTDDLGLMILRMYYQYKCTKIAIDGNGVGQPLVDYCLQDRYDPMYGITYPGLNVCNNDDIASRCKIKNAPKVIYVIKANANFNNDAYLSLRAGFQNGNINLLISDASADEFIRQHIKGFARMSPQDQAMYLVPYLQTTLLIEELAKLEHTTVNGKISVKERSGMRKDRASSILYNYYVCQEISRNLKPKKDVITDYSQVFKIRAPKTVTRFK